VRPAQRQDLSICPACRANNLAEARYCQACGIKLERDSVPADAPESLRVLSVDPEAPTQSPAHLADPLIGVIVADRYRIIEPIGRGGMGVVYKVEHARIGKLMAMKLLTGELTRDRDLVERFKREALMASQLSHPNTVQVFDFGNSEGLTYLAMEYLRGEDLGRIVRKNGSLSTARTAKIVIQICSSLAEAHDKGIVHRDLKPENIFILRGQSGDDVVKVLDFGLAKLRESSELGEVTTRGAIVGTPFYMSPEQIRGEPVEPRSDVYSLGALTYACLTGQPVFDAPTPMAILTKHLTDEPQSPTLRAPSLGIRRSTSAIVMKALCKDPERRFQSVRELQQALVEELKGTGQDSVDNLLDTGEVLKLASAGEDAATRDEVERYERKLRRRGQVVWSALLIGAAAGASVAWHFAAGGARAASFDGNEVEPNNAASEATPLPFGVEILGTVGQRLDPARSDRDFFRFEVPRDVKLLSIEASALPNMATCTLLYRVGLDSPIGHYCTGAPGKDLGIGALEITPGAYLLAVMQDRNQYTENPPPPVLENVSDAYRLRVAAGTSGGEDEVEPNDDTRDSTPVAPGRTLRGRLAWMRDVDVICANATQGSIRFVVEDAIGGARPLHAVLELTPEGGPGARVPVRIHRGGITPSAHDAKSPWVGPVVTLGPSTPRACVSLKLAPNPLAPTPHPRVAPASNDEYLVRLDAL
jgi:eukaryotic-like serine/threonine-protein kinase